MVRVDDWYRLHVHIIVAAGMCASGTCRRLLSSSLSYDRRVRDVSAVSMSTTNYVGGHMVSNI